jgi:hypothetical protein
MKSWWLGSCSSLRERLLRGDCSVIFLAGTGRSVSRRLSTTRRDRRVVSLLVPLALCRRLGAGENHLRRWRDADPRDEDEHFTLVGHDAGEVEVKLNDAIEFV